MLPILSSDLDRKIKMLLKEIEESEPDDFELEINNLNDIKILAAERMRQVKARHKTPKSKRA